MPLQRFVDRDGVVRSALHITLNEAASAGIEEVCLVVHPGDSDAYAEVATGADVKLTFVTQPSPRGYADAVLCAREFVGDDSFLHLVGDHLWVAAGEESCAKQLVEIAEAEAAAVSAVQATRENNLPLYGAVGGRRVAQRRDLYEADRVVEKPTPTQAEQELVVPGLRAGHYLCLFGMHVLPPSIMEFIASADGEDASLSSALSALSARERLLAHESAGRRYNLGVKYGHLHAQLALAISGSERETVLSQLVELLALRDSDRE